jgi:hypothetical protein
VCVCVCVCVCMCVFGSVCATRQAEKGSIVIDDFVLKS